MTQCETELRHGLDVMVSGLSTNWKQPISNDLTSGPIKSPMLYSLLCDYTSFTLGLSSGQALAQPGLTSLPSKQKILIKVESSKLSFHLSISTSGHSTDIPFPPSPHPPLPPRSLPNLEAFSSNSMEDQRPVSDFIASIQVDEGSLSSSAGIGDFLQVVLQATTPFQCRSVVTFIHAVCYLLEYAGHSVQTRRYTLLQFRLDAQKKKKQLCLVVFTYGPVRAEKVYDSSGRNKAKKLIQASSYD
ncbi:hypothetical protein RRG08_066400 [Elysia crispata]|uniref:Uncharacterized protein n=1 Tax=Elysia crispata TaxID=231223 RepID=A0AAE1D3R5_9GAST|nr:hypothetical protein RRG08_066400 [Elysia crispata]